MILTHGKVNLRIGKTQDGPEFLKKEMKNGLLFNSIFHSQRNEDKLKIRGQNVKETFYCGWIVFFHLMSYLSEWFTIATIRD